VLITDIVTARSTIAIRVMEKDNHDPPKIFIGGLPSRGITTRKLRSHFARYGNVVEAVAMEHPDGLGRGFGFVEYEDEAAVLRALDSRESVNHDTFFRCRVSFFFFFLFFQLSPALTALRRRRRVLSLDGGGGGDVCFVAWDQSGLLTEIAA
jgi:hypothetical protein